MAEKQHRAIVLTDFWAKILGTLLASGIFGGIGYAWNANANNAVLQEKVEVLQKADLPSRLDKLEVKVDEANKKLDMLIRSDIRRASR